MLEDAGRPAGPDHVSGDQRRVGSGTREDCETMEEALAPEIDFITRSEESEAVLCNI